jgi:hypothetical protein
VPEVALLFKAKRSGPKDLHDFMGALPLLTAQARAWLAGALRLVHPGHAWLALLDDTLAPWRELSDLSGRLGPWQKI